jgi:hypothetical protein
VIVKMRPLAENFDWRRRGLNIQSSVEHGEEFLSRYSMMYELQKTKIYKNENAPLFSKKIIMEAKNPTS